MNRKITEQEKKWLIRGLNTLKTGRHLGGGLWVDIKTGKTLPLDKPIDPNPFLDQIDDLRIVYKCKCGNENCHTVHFQNYRRGRSDAIVNYHTKDERLLIIFADQETGKLSELEII